MIRLLLVVDQPEVRKGLRMRLAAECDLAVIAEAEDCRSALDLATLLEPDVVLVDADMPHLNGLAAANALRAGCPHASVVMLSMRDDLDTRRYAEQAGAAAFVAKSLPADHLLTAIRRVARPSRISPGAATA